MGLFMGDRLMKTLRVAFAVAVLGVAVVGYVIYERTLVEWWLPVVTAAVVAVVTLPLARKSWRWLVGGDNTFLTLCHLYVAGGLVYGLLLTANGLLTDAASAYEEEVTVLGKEHVTRRTGYRSGRHYRTTSRVTDNYYLTVRFADGTVKELPVSRDAYYRAHKDRPRKVSVERGLLGFRVVW